MARRVRITWVRHSQAAKPHKGMKDALRRLVDKGKRIAAKRKKTFTEAFDLAIVSYATRTMETFLAIADVPTYVVTKSLFHGINAKDEQVLDAAFEKLKYSPLSVYYAESDDVASAMSSLAEKAWDLVSRMIDATGAENVLVVGHDIWMQAIIASAMESPVLNPLLDENWPFCGGVTVVLEDGLIVEIERLPELV